MCTTAACAPAARLHVGGGRSARTWRREAERAEAAAAGGARALLALLHAPASRRAVAFPHPRLLQYDCGEHYTVRLNYTTFTHPSQKSFFMYATL